VGGDAHEGAGNQRRGGAAPRADQIPKHPIATLIPGTESSSWQRPEHAYDTLERIDRNCYIALMARSAARSPRGEIAAASADDPDADAEHRPGPDLFLDELRKNRRNQAEEVVEAMGGKGCDVSLILAELGEETTATGLAEETPAGGMRRCCGAGAWFRTSSGPRVRPGSTRS